MWTVVAVRPPLTCSAVTRIVCSTTLIAGVPIALEWLAGERADFAAVGEEHNFLDLP